MLLEVVKLYNYFDIKVAAHAANLGYGAYVSDNEANSRKLHNVKSHQQISNTSQPDTNRPIEEMPYQVKK